MKYLLTLFIASLLFQAASGQVAKHVIQFSNKGNNGYNLSNPQQFLSTRAIARRTRFNISIDSTDLPVTERYVDSVRLSGSVIILSRSKWLNQVLIQTNDATALNKIRSFPFVKNVNAVGFRQAAPPVSVREKFKEEIKPITEKAAGIQRTTADYYNYGLSYPQVHIHEGEFLHNKDFRGQSMQITVLDAGFYQYKTITAFDSLRNNGQVLGERDFVAYDNSVNEDDSHGMHCLSILSANWPGRMVGTAPKANYWLIRTENASSEYPIEEHNWVVGAEFADSTGSDMISSSLGYYDFDDPSFNHSYNDFYKNTTTVSKGAAMAVKKGMIVTNSAGNEGGNSWKYIIFPADVDSVCTVGAVNAIGQIAGFSSYGYPGKVKPNIVSVGEGTVVAEPNNQPAYGNGTSYSNPNVAGLIACLWQAFPAYNNMKILDAVYRSSDRFSAPTDRYGYGIPNFKRAYRLLKHDQNVSLYGNDWLFVQPDPFKDTIGILVIGRVDGNAKVELLNSIGSVLATNSLSLKVEEINRATFTNLGSLPAGVYSVRYTDSIGVRTITIRKPREITDGWLLAAPNPFRNTLSVVVKAPETGNATLRLLDSKGSKVDEITITVTEGQYKTVNFDKSGRLAKGIYFIQFNSSKYKQTTRVTKL